MRHVYDPNKFPWTSIFLSLLLFAEHEFIAAIISAFIFVFFVPSISIFMLFFSSLSTRLMCERVCGNAAQKTERASSFSLFGNDNFSNDELGLLAHANKMRSAEGEKEKSEGA
jgi:hypothetical protein